MAGLSIVESQPLPKDAPLSIVSSEPLPNEPTAKPRFRSRMVEGSSLLSAANDPIKALKSLTGVDQVQDAMKSYDAGDHKAAALKLLQFASSNPATRMANSLIDTSKDQFGKAWDAFKRGDYQSAVAHFGAGTVPILAPAVNGTDLMKAGDIAGGLGLVAGNAIDLAAPKIVEGAPGAFKATRAAVSAGGADVAAGAAKTVAGAAATYAAHQVLPGTELAAALGVKDLVKTGAGQIVEGVKSGYKAGRAAIAPTQPPPIPPVVRTPAWSGIPDPQPVPPIDATPIPGELPSGRVPGPATAAEYRSSIRRPAWADIPNAQPAAAADATPIPSQLASGRRPLTAQETAAKYAAQAEATPSAAAPQSSENIGQLKTPSPAAAAAEPPSRYDQMGDNFRTKILTAAKAKDAAIADWASHPDRGITADQIAQMSHEDFAALQKQVNPKYKPRVNDPEFAARKQDVVDLMRSREDTASATKAANALNEAGISFAKAKDMSPEQLGLGADAKPKAVADVLFQLKKLELAPNDKVGDPNGLASPGQADSTASGQTGVDAGTAGAREALPEPVRTGAPSTSVKGNATRIDVPGEARSYQGHYAISELADIQPSHQGATFQPNPKYQLRNDRNYDNPVNQAKIVNWSTADAATGFKPTNLINDVPDSSSGPPVTDSVGNALGGNGRTMIAQRVSKSNPNGAQAYRELLNQKASQFGIDPASFANMKEPFLHRVVDDSEFTRAGRSKQAAVTDFNKTGTASLTPAERSIADSRRVSTSTLDEISRRLEDKGPDATLSQVLEGRSGTELLSKLVDDGVISPQERAGLATETGLTKAGKKRVSSLMVGRFFENAAQMDTLPASLRNKVERIAAPLARVEGSDFSLSPQIQKALTLVEDAQAHGAHTLDEHLAQSGLFANEKYPPQAVGLAKQLQSRDAVALTKAIRRYVEEADYAANYQGPGMFNEFPPPKTPAQAFEENFGAKALADEAAGKAAAKDAKATAQKYATN